MTARERAKRALHFQGPDPWDNFEITAVGTALDAFNVKPGAGGSFDMKNRPGEI